MRVLFIGDIVGEPGRKMVRSQIRSLNERYQPELVIANGENAAGGFGITPDIAEELFSLGIHVLTSGNHVWDKKEIEPYLTKQDRLIRPANYPPENPGYGSVVISTAAGKAAVLNLEGRVFMSNLEDPFRTAGAGDRKAQERDPDRNHRFSCRGDFREDRPGLHLDGKASAVIGTHTHVQTADERILASRNGLHY